MKFNTRIAPSPTGHIHLGTLRTGYHNWLAARASGGEFTIRIDNTDRVRSDNKYTVEFLQLWDWLGLDYDRIIYQSNNVNKYHLLADHLIDSNQAIKNNDGSITLDIKSNYDISWKDSISNKTIGTQDNFDKWKNRLTIIKNDGWPTYHFASVNDDIDLNINWIIRGTDHIPNTARQVLIYKLFGSDIPKYSHTGLIFKDKKKMNKRSRNFKAVDYMSKYNPNAILNYLLRLAWSPTQDDKSNNIIDKDKALSLFLTGGKLKNSPSNFDLKKLDWYHKKYS